MAEEIAVFEKFFRAELLDIADVVTCVAEKLFNTFVPPNTPMTYGVFKVIPLADKTGQARTSIITRLLVDLKFVTGMPVDPNIAPAVAAAKEHFRSSRTFDAEGFRISVRHDRPIEMPEIGVTAGEQLLHKGSTFWVSMSAV